MSELDTWFPRGDVIMTAQPETAFVDGRNFKSFWPSAHNLCDSFGIPLKDHERFVHDFFKVKSMHHRPEPFSELLAQLAKRGATFAELWTEMGNAKLSTETPDLSASHSPDEPLPERVVSAPPVAKEVKPTSKVANDNALDENEIRAKYNKNLKGKDYLQVAGRVLLFRVKYPRGSISTEMIHFDDKGAVMRATVADDTGTVLATGHAAALLANAGNYMGRFIEKAETSAIGRALAHAGFGTDEAEEGDFIADSPVGK